MSDSLFLDPFAPPPSPDGPGSSDRDSVRFPDGEVTSLAAELPLEPERAVEAFLEYVHLWWPSTLRATDGDGHVGFEDGLLIEEGQSGRRHHWAGIAGIDGASLSLRWFGAARGPVPGPGTEVTVAFAAESATQTRVTVRGSDPSSFLADWRRLLEGYARFTGGAVRAS
jgi:hypothetical protein